MVCEKTLEICSNALAVLAILKIYLRQKYCEVDILQFGSNFPPKVTILINY
jgi:hypothetical protein